jgi:hypothetical protein
MSMSCRNSPSATGPNSSPKSDNRRERTIASRPSMISANRSVHGALRSASFHSAAIATGEHYTPGLGKAGADALTLLYVDSHHNGFILNAMFYGLWLAPLGYLAIKSGYVPKVLGVLLVIGCFGYLADLFTYFLAPELGTRIGLLFAAIGGIPELVFVVWLLVKAVPVSTPDARVPVPADAGTSS